MNRQVVWGCVGLLLAGSLASAHDMKVMAERFKLKPGEKTDVFISYGHHLPADEFIDAELLEVYSVVDHQHSARPLVKEGKSLQNNSVEFPEAGIHQAVAVKKPVQLQKVIDPDGRHKHIRGPKSAVKPGDKIEESLETQQFAKAMIVVGDGKDQTAKPVGLPIEIVPVDAADQWKSGGKLRFKVIFDGQPLAEEEVEATYVGQNDEGDYFKKVKTDKDGVATIDVANPGQWIIKASKKKPAKGAAKEQFDEHALTGTLSLQVDP